MIVDTQLTYLVSLHLNLLTGPHKLHLFSSLNSRPVSPIIIYYLSLNACKTAIKKIQLDT